MGIVIWDLETWARPSADLDRTFLLGGVQGYVNLRPSRREMPVYRDSTDMPHRHVRVNEDAEAELSGSLAKVDVLANLPISRPRVCLDPRPAPGGAGRAGPSSHHLEGVQFFSGQLAVVA